MCLYKFVSFINENTVLYIFLAITNLFVAFELSGKVCELGLGLGLFTSRTSSQHKLFSSPQLLED